MIGRIIGYLAAVLVTAYLFFMYDAYVISGLLLFLILYFFIALLWMLLMRGKLVPVPDRVPAMGEPGKRIRAGVTLRNQSKRMDLRSIMPEERAERRSGIADISARGRRRRSGANSNRRCAGMLRCALIK